VKRSLRQIVREKAESLNLQPDWDRQLLTAERIADHHNRGLRTVLLADEVGMGKTYVAMATIAHHIFQSDENNRKVLLVVPPNNILQRKWEQEIRTFNDKYLRESLRKDMRKTLRPMVVTDYWELIRNLHDFENQKTPRVSEGMLQCFAFATWNWNLDRRKRGTWKKEWPLYGKVDHYDTGYLDFCSWYSPRAIADFLDEELANNPHGMATMIKDFNNGQKDDGRLKELFKKFGRKQDFYEANVFVIGMATLRRTKISAEDSKLLSSYIASLLLKGCWEDTKKNALKQLVKHNSCVKPDGIADCGNPHLRWFSELGLTNMWGMREAVAEVIQTRGDRDLLIDRILNGDNLDQLFKMLQADVISAKLKTSDINLAVVDEVHNWKAGNNGATEFEKRYAAAIQNKLIMSATPFQLHQDELGKVFKAAAGSEDKSLEVVNHILEDNGIAQKCLVASDDFLHSWGLLGTSDHQLLSSITLRDSGGKAALMELRSHSDISECLVSFLDCTEKYEVAVSELRSELSKIIIRHTKNRDKRHFHAGREYTVAGRPNYAKTRRTLYSVPGFGDSTDALMNFMAMRVDQMVRRDTQTKGYATNAHLLGGITSSNQAFLDSNGKLLNNEKVRPDTKRYLNFFASALQTNNHPKVDATVSRAFKNFCDGHKTLIFCERLATQTEILSQLEKMINKTIFPKGGFDQAKRDREGILKDHEAVELFFSRSYLCTLPDKARDASSKQIVDRASELLEQVSGKVDELGGNLNQRQLFKLVDLAILRSTVAKNTSASSVISRLFDFANDALRRYLRIKDDPESQPIDEAPKDSEQPAETLTPDIISEILFGSSIWYARPDSALLHKDLWDLIDSEIAQLSQSDLDNDLQIVASTLLDLGQGLRKVLLRLDRLQALERIRNESLSQSVIRLLSVDPGQEHQSSWQRTHDFVRTLVEAEGTIRRSSARSSKRQSLWKGVFLRDERIVSELNGATDQEKRINLCAAFNSPLLPDILICTAIGSEGIDLHRHCADVIHHDLPWNPAKLEQRTGRIDRVGSLAERSYLEDEFRLNIGIPFLAHNYEQFQYGQLLTRAQRFEILLGRPEFTTDVEEAVQDVNGNEIVVETAIQGFDDDLDATVYLPEWIVDFLRMDLSIFPLSDLALRRGG
jgi:superfamily II DNA or RNA helicase